MRERGRWGEMYKGGSSGNRGADRIRGAPSLFLFFLSFSLLRLCGVICDEEGEERTSNSIPIIYPQWISIARRYVGIISVVQSSLCATVPWINGNHGRVERPEFSWPSGD